MMAGSQSVSSSMHKPQTKTVAEAVAANAAALREFAGAERRQSEAGGTAEPQKDEYRTFMADFHRWADAQRGYRLWWSALALAVVVPAFFLLGVLVELQFQIIPAYDCQSQPKIAHFCQSKIAHFGLGFVPPDAVLGVSDLM